MELAQESVLVVAAVAVAAPILADLTKRVRVPIVVAEVALGILVGPEVLDLARPDDFLEALSTFGLGFLFFLAGLEIDFAAIAGRASKLAVSGWGLSLLLGPGIALALWAIGAIDAPVLVGLALTTTALGTLMPILRDAGVLGGRFGTYLVAAGAAGEFLPVVAISVILAVEAGEPARTSLLLVFGAVAAGAAFLAMRARPARVVRLIQTTMGTSGQLAVRLSVLMIAALVVLAAELGQDVILGAFTAGIVVGIVIRGTDASEFEAKLDAVGFGFLIPIFFIVTGMDYDLDALLDEPASLVMVPGFAALFLLSRGLPAMLLYREDLDRSQLPSLALFSAAALPLVIAITEIGTDTGAMPEQEAVALVGAGMLSVLLFPVLALALRRGPD
ncbi:MAG TPA: cation:proton antiporter [Solirubrobacterales bacterium]|jgi:Kef-type K+ transport system membrane component KefB|nr:cation:proton antiporter [Solirubrobacterales bacterium]